MTAMNKALFLDRDGILIEDVCYPHRPQDLNLNLDLIPYLRWAIKEGFLLIIVTNQAGIAKGKFTLKQYEMFQSELEKDLAYLKTKIDATYYCPYHKDGIIKPYNIDSEDRKPKPGMIIKAVDEFNIDLKQSFMIGDKMSDKIEIADLRCYILESEYNRGEKGTYSSFEDIFKEIKSGM